MTYQIKEITQRTNIPASTLRYYEELGLLTPFRNQQNYREYSERDLEWLQFIQRIKETGMTMKEIQHYSALRKKGNSTLTERLALLTKQENFLREQQTKLQNDLAFIEKKKAHYQNLLD